MYDKLSANQLSSTTILYVHSVLRKALNTTIKRRVLTRNPIDYVDAPLKSRYKATVLSSEQVNTLFHSLGHDAISMAVLLAVTLGLRRGEVLGLKWSDFDLSSKTITICRTANFYHKELVLSDVKTPNSNRSLCLADELVHLLEEYHQQQTQEASRIDHYNPENLILCDKLGNPITTNVLNKRFKSILQQVNLPAIRFHDLRHTNATLMLKQNIPAKIVSTMLGHSTVGITLDTYSHVLTEMQQPAVNVIQNLLSGRSGDKSVISIP